MSPLRRTFFGVTFKPVLNWENVSSRTQLEVFGEASWFLIGPTFLQLEVFVEATFGSKKLRSTYGFCGR